MFWRARKYEDAEVISMVWSSSSEINKLLSGIYATSMTLSILTTWRQNNPGPVKVANVMRTFGGKDESHTGVSDYGGSPRLAATPTFSSGFVPNSCLFPTPFLIFPTHSLLNLFLILLCLPLLVLSSQGVSQIAIFHSRLLPGCNDAGSLAQSLLTIIHKFDFEI